MRRALASSRGLRMLGGTCGDDLLELVSAQQVRRDALALLKLGQDDGDVSVSGGLVWGGTRHEWPDNVSKTWTTSAEIRGGPLN